MPYGYPAQTPRRPMLGGSPAQRQMSRRDVDLTRKFLGPTPAPSRRTPTGLGVPPNAGWTPTSPVSPLYPSPATFSQTPAGRAILQRVLQQYTGRRGIGR